jgi:glutathione peroxidase-family protein
MYIIGKVKWNYGKFLIKTDINVIKWYVRMLDFSFLEKQTKLSCDIFHV